MKTAFSSFFFAMLMQTLISCFLEALNKLIRFVAHVSFFSIQGHYMQSILSLFFQPVKVCHLLVIPIWNLNKTYKPFISKMSSKVISKLSVWVYSISHYFWGVSPFCTSQHNNHSMKQGYIQFKVVHIVCKISIGL